MRAQLYNFGTSKELVWNPREKELEFIRQLTFAEVEIFYKQMILESPHAVVFRTFSVEHEGDIESLEMDNKARANEFVAPQKLTVHLASD